MAIKAQLTDVFKLLGYQIVYFAVKCLPVKKRERRLLLVKTDDIGDYVLFRNLLVKFKASGVYRGYSITLVGNMAFRQLFEAYDAGTADETIWLDKVRFRRDMSYRFSFLKDIRRSGYSDAINLIYSRSWRLDDLLVAVSGASKKVAMKTTDHPVSLVERLLTPRHIYNRLEEVGGESDFDGNRNARFAAKLLQTGIEPVSIQLPDAMSETGLSLPPAYAVFVPGSGNPNKRWPTDHFVAIARHMKEKFGLTPVICGSRSDLPDTEPLYAAVNGFAEDLTGRTSLCTLVSVLKGAQCLISVDTGAVHLAAAVGCPVFGLFSGFHYGRFAPYPPEVSAYVFPIYPDEIDEKLNSGRLDPRSVPLHLMNRISPEKVIRLVDKELPVLLRTERKTGIQTN